MIQQLKPNKNQKREIGAEVGSLISSDQDWEKYREIGAMQRCMRNRTERIKKGHHRGEENKIFVDNTTYLTEESGK